MSGGTGPLELCPPTADRDGMLHAFGTVLDSLTTKSRRALRVSLTISDTLAAIVSLPWQQALSRPAEIDAYARAQFDRLGQPLDEQWTMFSYFRHFRAAGLAYAIPTVLLQELRDAALARNVVLASVIPASAQAFASGRPSKTPGATVLVLRESDRVSALVYDANGLCAYAVEPRTRSTPEPLRRLLPRLCAAYQIEAVEAWSLCASSEDMEPIVKTSLPDVHYAQLSHEVWN
jgi:hypothetical protein